MDTLNVVLTQLAQDLDRLKGYTSEAFYFCHRGIINISAFIVSPYTIF